MKLNQLYYFIAIQLSYFHCSIPKLSFLQKTTNKYTFSVLFKSSKKSRSNTNTTYPAGTALDAPFAVKNPKQVYSIITITLMTI